MLHISVLRNVLYIFRSCTARSQLRALTSDSRLLCLSRLCEKIGSVSNIRHLLIQYQIFALELLPILPTPTNSFMACVWMSTRVLGLKNF